MPGAQDRWDQFTEPSVRSQEALVLDPPRVADRPERGSLGDLRQRLERLPAGHPSSPYNDDLSRKSPVARLKDLELPLHGNERDTNGAAAHHDQEVAERAPAAGRAEAARHNGSAARSDTSDGLPMAGGLTAPDGLTVLGGLPAAGEPSAPDGPTMVGGLPAAGEPSAPDGPTMVGGLPAAAWSSTADWSDTAGRSGATDAFSTDNRIGADDRSGTDDVTGAGHRTSADELTGTGHRTSADQLTGTDDGPATDVRTRTDRAFGIDGRVGPGDTVGADHGTGADDPVSADDPVGIRGWSTDSLNSTDDGISATDWRSADGEVRDSGKAGNARWSSGDDLSTTAEWNRATEWGSTPDWDSPTSDWGDSGHHDRADKPEWAEPGPAIETGDHAVAGNGRSHRSDEPRSGLDGSWEWNGRYLAPDECQIADEALTHLRTAEGRNVFGSYGHSGLTPVMRRLEAQLEHGQLLPDTERYALKPADLFKESVADLILRHPDKPAEELPQEVPDGIRYAYIFDSEHYADATLQVHSRLKGQGFELEVRRNSWRNPEYKGISTRWRDPAHDVVFEVQFHTAPSWDAKHRAQAAHRQIMDPATPPAERARLRAIQAETSAAIPVPPRCTAIPDYRKEAL